MMASIQHYVHCSTHRWIRWQGPPTEWAGMPFGQRQTSTSAYRLGPMHSDDRKWLGMEWKGAHYVDAMPPFGLRSAPKLFMAVDGCLEWCIRQKGVTGIDHYLDDFVIVAALKSNTCQTYMYLTKVEEEYVMLGVILAPEKTEGPTSCLIFLGTVAGRHCLPQDKLSHL